MKLDLDKVSWGVEGRDIVSEVSLAVEEGQFVGLIGPNGSGKSSLLRTIYRINRPHAGRVLLGGDAVWDMHPQQLARRAAVVLQDAPSEFAFTVWEMVLMGRSPHKSVFETESEDDHRIVEHALATVGLEGFAERLFSTLSGGERQRVLVARALAQQPRFLVLDEPTNHLDIRYQLEILGVVKTLGVGALASLHDLNLAALFCDRLYLLFKGRLAASGAVEEVLRPELIDRVYGVQAEIAVHPATGRPHVTFLPREVPR